MTPDDPAAKARDAIAYVLTRAQTDPNLRYYLSPHTEAWERLVAAEAALLGREDRDAHWSERAKSLVTGDRVAEVIELREELGSLERGIV